MTGDDELARTVMDDYTTAELSPRERALMDYAVKLTHSPAEMTAADVAELRRHGLTDRAVLDACHVIGYFNHINRLADALGIDPEPEMAPHPQP